MATKRNTGLLFIVILMVIAVQKASCKVSEKKYGVLAAESSSDKENFCIIYFPECSSLPEKKSKAVFHILEDLTDVDFCSVHPQANYKRSIILMSRNNCSLADQARVIQDCGGGGALFIAPVGKVDHIEMNSSAVEDINITVALISENSVQRLKTMQSPTVLMFAPQSFNFDFSLLIIWIVAMFSVSVGSYWSGLIRFSIYCKEVSKLPGPEREHISKPNVQHQNGEESALNVSPLWIGVFVLCMGAMLMLLYFFFDYLVYFIIGLFVLASIISVYNLLEPLHCFIPTGSCRLPECHVACVHCAFEGRHLIHFLFLALSVSLSVTWVVLRKERFSWILQDILGVAFCINMLKSIRLPNLKICAILLILLFFYDIFFVFVTPFLTVKGESVMEEVATGGRSEEMLPMVLRVPHFGFDPLTVCYQQYSLLGFGDILVPGLLISYCHGFDLITNKKKIYFPVTVAMYGIGLIITFVGLYIMSTAQPALLYLVPATLLPPLILGWWRGELLLLWNGFKTQKHIEPLTEPTSQTIAVANVDANVGLPPSSSSSEISSASLNKNVDQEVSNVSETVNDFAGERKHLLR